MTSTAAILAYIVLPIAALLIAGLFAIARPAGPRMRSAIMHLAAGVVFAVVASELLPSIIHSTAIVAVILGFSAGTALMLVLRKLVKRDEHEGEENTAKSSAPDTGSERVESPGGMIVAIAIDLAVDGLMLGLGFAAGERAGALLAIALTIEVVSLGLAVATTLRTTGVRTARILKILVALALSLAIGTAAGGLGMRFAPPSVLPGLLAFGAAALLFLVTEELLEDAHEVKETPALTAMFFVGFLALMVLEMVERS